MTKGQGDAVLTIGIPTFNRRAAVFERLGELRALRQDRGFDVLVIDNASTDGTYDALIDEFGSEFTILRNEENLGYARNLLLVLETARSEYVLATSDEDRVEPVGLDLLLDFLRADHPRFVSPRADVRSNALYRGRAETRSIQPAEYHAASFYISGLTFRTRDLKPGIDLIRSLHDVNSAASVYPQVLLTALAVANGDSCFLDAVVTRQVVSLDTHITETSGAHYADVKARWDQFLGYEAFFAMELPVDAERRSALLAEMREETRRLQPKILFAAAAAEVPGIARYLPQSPRPNMAQRIVARARRH